MGKEELSCNLYLQNTPTPQVSISPIYLAFSPDSADSEVASSADSGIPHTLPSPGVALSIDSSTASSHSTPQSASWSGPPVAHGPGQGPGYQRSPLHVQTGGLAGIPMGLSAESGGQDSPGMSESTEASSTLQTPGGRGTPTSGRHGSIIGVSQRLKDLHKNSCCLQQIKPWRVHAYELWSRLQRSYLCRQLAILAEMSEIIST